MCSLLSYCGYIGWREKLNAANSKKIFYYCATFVFAVLSMLAKPMALSLPLVLFLIDWHQARRWKMINFTEKAPILCMVAFLGWLTYIEFSRVPGNNLFEGIMVWLWTFIFYLRQFVFPVFSVPIHNLPKPVALSNYTYLMSVIASFMVIVSLVKLRKYKWFMFSFLFYFLSIFFLLRFDDVSDITFVADRFMYLPSVGFCFLLGLF